MTIETQPWMKIDVYPVKIGDVHCQVSFQGGHVSGFIDFFVDFRCESAQTSRC